MLFYALKRVALGLLILLVTMTVMYSTVYLVPGDPAAVALGPRATPELKASLRHAMGLDQPAWQQLWSFLAQAVTGDLGVDVRNNRPVGTTIAEVLPYTLALGSVALGSAALLGVILGSLAVLYRDSWLDRALGLLSVSVIALPTFLIAIYSVLLFAVKLNWFPAIGAGEPGDIGSQLRALVLPAFAIGVGWVGYLARMVRASLLEVMGEQHIRTARAFGLSEWTIITRYALRIAIVPTISVVAVGLGGILSGAVFVEVIFGRPGIGNLAYTAAASRNYPVVMGTVLVTTAIYVSITILADLLIASLDPRVRDVFRS